MKAFTNESSARLFAIAEEQGGFFTARQAEEMGFDRRHHAYHVQAGNWQREYRGIFRLSRFPPPERSDLILWSLWSRNRKDQPQGVYSHQTALSIYDLSDLMPSKLHLTVPRSFRRSAVIPPILSLHYHDLTADQIERRSGFQVTRPLHTILEMSREQEVPEEILTQAFSEAKMRGLITSREIELHRSQLPAFLMNQPLQAA